MFSQFCILFRIYSVLPPQYFLRPPVTNYMLLYSRLLCKKVARAPGGRKKYKPTRLGGWEQNRSPVSINLTTFEAE